MPTVTFNNQVFSDILEAYFSGATIKVAVMASGFTYDRDAHEVWADVSASQITVGNGYVDGGQALDNYVAAEDDVNDRGTGSFDNESITASGGDFPAAAGLLYYNTSDADTIVVYVAFDSDQTVTDGNSIDISAQQFRLSQAS